MKLILDTNPSDQDIEEIRLGLVEHNRPFLEDMQEQAVACYIHHPQHSNAKIAGVSGQVRGEWLMVQFLWVAPEFKGQGLGGKLLDAAEAHARSLGCHSVMLDTWSFQARPFYEKRGYVVQMTQNDFHNGAEKYHLFKRL